MKKGGRYRCPKCGETFESMPETIIRCPVCANKILLKVRQPVAKNLKAR